MSNDVYRFRVKFDSQEHSINTETYIQALVSLTTILKESNYQLGQGEKISIDVAAEEGGSFDVAMVLKATEHLFSADTVTYLNGLVGIAGGLVLLKKAFKKADPEKTEINGDDVTIKDTEGNVLVQTNRNTYNIYTTNQVVRDALSNHFRSLDEDGEITGFEINYDDESVRVEKDEFDELAVRQEIELPDKDVTEVPAKLVIVKLVFEGQDRKWEFIYNGVKISATIVDDNFWIQINQGKQFGKGDELIADLRITREYDADVAAYFNRDYEVINVREHHPRQFREQASLDDINDH